jgi:DNA (cytosine-5)-methyltransferase 1
MPRFIDLFAGAGGLSEGFIRAGYTPIAHVEMNKEACDTLKTRAAFHYLKRIGSLDIYERYLREKKEKEDGSKLWNQVPKQVIDSGIQEAIGENTINDLFTKIDGLKGNNSVDIIIGGPPCQAYSVAGRARLGTRVEEDPRNELYKYYVKFIEYYRPKMFVFENVMGIKTAKGGGPFEDLQRLVRDLGYEIEPREQIASNYGVLQKRHRMIIVGWKTAENGTPTNYHYPDLNPCETKYKIARDLFYDLPERKSNDGSLCECIEYTQPLSEMQYLKESGIRGELDFTTQHVSRFNNELDREIYARAVKMLQEKGEKINYAKLEPRLQKHKNKDKFLNRFNVVDPDGCCHTIVAHIAMDGHYYIYPTPNPTIENARSITVREAARIQSFPDDYFFEGSRTAAFRQIGNAVPVMMSYNIALSLLNQLE